MFSLLFHRLAEAVNFAVHLEDVTAMSESMEKCGGLPFSFTTKLAIIGNYLLSIDCANRYLSGWVGCPATTADSIYGWVGPAPQLKHGG